MKQKVNSFTDDLNASKIINFVFSTFDIKFIT